MKRMIVTAVLAAAALLLSGCGSFLYREYSVVTPHASTYYENEDVLRAESYQDMVNDLLILVGEQKKEGAIWLYPKKEMGDISALVQQACREVQEETPLGTYAVDYLTYTLDVTPRNYVSIALTIGYRRTAAQMDAMVHTTSISALPDLLAAAVENGAAELTVQVSYFEQQEAEVRSMVADAQSKQGDSVQDVWQVNFYPNGSSAEIIEIILEK